MDLSRTNDFTSAINFKQNATTTKMKIAVPLKGRNRSSNVAFNSHKSKAFNAQNSISMPKTTKALGMRDFPFCAEYPSRKA